jgi:hypothetical protein
MFIEEVGGMCYDFFLEIFYFCGAAGVQHNENFLFSKS